MDKNAIKKYAVWARRELLSRVAQKALQYGVDGTTPADPDADTVNDKLLTADEKSRRRALIDAVAESGYEQVLEEAAYTWFNRFCALRFMEVNNYLPSHTRVFTDENNAFAPQILAEAIRVELPGLDRDLVYKYKEANDDDALYKYLLITQCNALQDILPGMFSEISGYTELLFPDNLLREGSAIEQMVALIPEDDWRDEVQIIGWLYQYYNSEKKDAVFAALKKNIKIGKDNIPAATQLFTPDWIVRYMVENSLGRLWVQGHPATPIKGEWKYYLEDAAQTPEVEARLADLRRGYAALTPEQLTCIDPCCGSGHILVYLFDVLMQIYTDYGYTAREAVESIVQNNLYGLDIDKRAAQLAYFAVMMTARRHDRGFLRHPVQPHVYAIAESNAVDKGAVEVFCNGDAKLTAAVAQILAEMQDAREYGSILATTPQDWAALYARFEELDAGGGMERTALLRLKSVVQAAEILSKQYWVTVTNPPYMGSSGMNAKLGYFVKEKYPDTKSDMSTVFMERIVKMCNDMGYISMLNIPVWMFLSSYEKLRHSLLENQTLVNMVHPGRGIFGSDFGTTTFVILNKHIKGYNGHYRRLFDKQGEVESVEQREQRFFEKRGVYFSSQDNFSKIPGSPVAYWASRNVIECFEQNKIIDEVAFPRQGLATGNNDEYLRLWPEVKESETSRSSCSIGDFFNSGKKYIPYNKGGAYRKWYANLEWVIRFDEDHYNVLQMVGNHLPSKEFYFRECITWSKVTAGGLSMRYVPTGGAFDVAGCSIFCKVHLMYLLAFTNTKVMQYLMNVLSQTLNYEVGTVKSIPIKWQDIDNVEETGKSHLYKEISPNSILVSGGQTTVANLFYNMGRKTVGLVGLWDCVAFDEVAGIRFKDKDGVQIMKDYMASGSFARGKEEKAASASMVFVGNINQSVDVLLKTSSLFDPFPPEMGTDTAFLDRIHCYLPGWEIPKFRPEHFTNSYGFISDYLAEFIRELRKVQYGDALDKYFKLGKNLNQRDTIAVRRMVDGYLKLMYPNGEFTKDELEEILRMALEMRRRVKEQLKKLGGMEFYDVNFSYIDNETFEEKYVCVPEQGGDTLIPEGMPAPGQVYTISRGKSGMIGAFRLESQMLPGNGKFDKTGLGTERDAKEATDTAFNFLKANARRISGNISTTEKNYVVNYQDLQGISMTDRLALPTVIALCSIALNRATLSSLVVLGDISIGGTLIKVDELANTLQACADCGAKKVLLPAVSMMDFATVPADLMTAFQLIPYQNAEDAVFKALGVE